MNVLKSWNSHQKFVIDGRPSGVINGDLGFLLRYIVRLLEIIALEERSAIDASNDVYRGHPYYLRWCG